MINKLLKWVMPFTIIIGIVALIPVLTLGTDQLTIVKNASVNYGNYTWNYYTIDIRQYLQNLESSIYAIQIKEGLPTLPTLPNYNVSNPLDVLAIIFNNSVVLLTNLLIYIVNWIVILPIKLLLYPIVFIDAILGFNTTETDYIWLINTIYNINIPYINYI